MRWVTVGSAVIVTLCLTSCPDREQAHNDVTAAKQMSNSETFLEVIDDSAQVETARRIAAAETPAPLSAEFEQTRLLVSVGVESWQKMPPPLRKAVLFATVLPAIIGEDENSQEIPPPCSSVAFPAMVFSVIVGDEESRQAIPPP